MDKIMKNLSPIQQIAYAILCAYESCEDTRWKDWADKWLSGKDRTPEAAAWMVVTMERDAMFLAAEVSILELGLKKATEKEIWRAKIKVSKAKAAATAARIAEAKRVTKKEPWLVAWAIEAILWAIEAASFSLDLNAIAKRAMEIK